MTFHFCFQFHVRPVRFCRTALNRQVGEAVRIGKRVSMTLNSKAEFNRCEIARLTLGEDKLVSRDFGEDCIAQEEELKAWLRKKHQGGEISQKKAEKLRARTLPKKHKKEDDPREKMEDDSKHPKKKRRMYDLIVGWGEERVTTTPTDKEVPGLSIKQPQQQRMVGRLRGCRTTPQQQPSVPETLHRKKRDGDIRSFFTKRQTPVHIVKTGSYKVSNTNYFEQDQRGRQPTDDIARGKEDLPTPGKRKRRDVLPPSTPSESEDSQHDTTPPSTRKRKTRGRDDDLTDVSEGGRTKRRGLAPKNDT